MRRACSKCTPAQVELIVVLVALLDATQLLSMCMCVCVSDSNCVDCFRWEYVGMPLCCGMQLKLEANSRCCWSQFGFLPRWSPVSRFPFRRECCICAVERSPLKYHASHWFSTTDHQSNMKTKKKPTHRKWCYKCLLEWWKYPLTMSQLPNNSTKVQLPYKNVDFI